MYFQIRSTFLQRLPLFAILAGLALSAGAAAADLSGSWVGHWESDSTGHRGPLRCNLSRIDESSYRADFSGRFFKIIPFRYSVVLDVVSDGDTVTLTGENYLGRRYGTFSYNATATNDEFIASYSSCKDDGQFVLSRCGSCSCGK